MDGATKPDARRPAARRVLLWGVGIGYVLPLLGTSRRSSPGATVPHLHLVWQLNFVFPAAVAYAIVRYQLFDVRAVVRMGAVYSVVTGLVALVYVGLLTGLDLFLARMHLDVAPVVSSAGVALAVVLLMNPVYGRVRRFVDRPLLPGPLRRPARARVARAPDDHGARAGPAGGARLPGRPTRSFARRTWCCSCRPTARAGCAASAGPGARCTWRMTGALMRVLTRLRSPLTRARLREDSRPRGDARAGLGELEAAGAEAAAPIFFRDRVTAVLALGRRRGDAEYLGEDLRVLRTLADQSAVALENARAYHALEAALRRVQILESIRANLSKFVPRVVQD
jgi:hypothetical protein